MSTRITRFDAFPENATYVDTGCEQQALCLSCRLDSCIYESPAARRKLARVRRGQLFIHLNSLGFANSDIAQRFGISKRTLQRLMAAARAHHGAPARRKRLVRITPVN